MSDHKTAAEALEQQVKSAFPKVKTRIEECAGLSMLDISIPEYQSKDEWINVMVRKEKDKTMTEYGFSIVDKDTGYGTGPDCLFDHIPTMLKFMKRLFPLAENDPAFGWNKS